VVSLVLITAGLPGGRQMFVLATAAIGAGLFGLGLHGPRQRRHATTEPAAALHVYRRSACRIEKPLLDKLVKAESALEQRVPEMAAGDGGREFQEAKSRAEKALAGGDLPAAFREHCRAMHTLLRAFNSQRHKEEVFQPVWDKHVGEGSR
jgi:hypothetical protein